MHIPQAGNGTFLLEIKNFQVQKQFQHVYQPNSKLTANCKLAGFHGLAKMNCKITARQAPHENQPLSFLPHMGSEAHLPTSIKKQPLHIIQGKNIGKYF